MRETAMSQKSSLTANQSLRDRIRHECLCSYRPVQHRLWVAKRKVQMSWKKNEAKVMLLITGEKE